MATEPFDIFRVIASMFVPLAAVVLSASLQGAEVVTFDVEGVSRSAVLFSPSKKVANPPLVFAFHGHGGTGRNSANSFRIQNYWHEAVVVYMNGLPTRTGNDPQGKKNGWQNLAGTNGNRDLKFFDVVYANLTKRFDVDKSAVFAMGHSNGGRFTHLLWAERGELLAAVGPSGSHLGNLKVTPKPLFHILGEKDPVVDPARQRESIEAVKKMNGCNGTGDTLATYTTRYKGKDGNDVVTFIHPGGHEFPRAASELLVSFFKSVIGSR